MSTRRGAAIGAVATALVAGAGAGPAPTATNGASTAWERRDLRPITQPFAVGDRIVLLVSQGGGVRLLGLDARSGATRWSVDGSSSLVAPGVLPQVAVVGDAVVHLVKVGGRTARLAATDASSGRPIWRSEDGLFTSYPDVCPGERSTICISGTLESQVRPETFLRFDARTGRRIAAPSIQPGAIGRSLGVGLFEAGRRDPELLVATAATRVTWRRPLRAIFTLRGASTDWGWTFDRVRRVGAFVGSVGAPPRSQTPTRLVFDMSRAMSAGFRIADGGLLWRSQGTTYVCGFLPCPGRTATSAGTAASAGAPGPSVGVRLRARGTLEAFPADPTRPVVSQDSRVTIEGFRPRDGRTRWSFPAGRDVGLVTQTSLPPQLSRTGIAVRERGAQLVALDLADGSHRPLRSHAWAWCSPVVVYEQSIWYDPSDPASNQYAGQFAIAPCTATGQVRATPGRAPRFVGSIGARAGELVVWSEPRGVVARPVSG